MTSSESLDKQQFWGVLSKLLFGVALLCFFSAFVLSCKGSQKLESDLSSSGGIAGPFTIQKANTVCQLKVRQDLSYSGPNKWSWIEFELLDEEKEALFGSGNELWAETGYDSEGTWRESKTNFKTNFIIREPGTYYLRATTDLSNAQAIGSPIHITLYTGAVSSVPLMWGGVIFLILAVVGFRQYGKQMQGQYRRSGSGSQVTEADFEI